MLLVLLADEPDIEAWTEAITFACSGGTYLQMIATIIRLVCRPTQRAIFYWLPIRVPNVLLENHFLWFVDYIICKLYVSTNTLVPTY